MFGTHPPVSCLIHDKCIIPVPSQLTKGRVYFRCGIVCRISPRERLTTVCNFRYVLLMYKAERTSTAQSGFSWFDHLFISSDLLREGRYRALNLSWEWALPETPHAEQILIPRTQPTDGVLRNTRIASRIRFSQSSVCSMLWTVYSTGGFSWKIIEFDLGLMESGLDSTGSG
jgi:hypothetical protein